MANNQEEPFDYFQDDDFLFDDNVFDAIDKQESIYLSTQQPPDPVHVQEERPNEVPTIEVTYRDPPQRTTDTLPTTGYSLRADDTAGLQWQSSLGQVESSGLQEHQQREIEGLRFTVERLQLRLKEDQLINENLSRELTVLRSDKQFMEQELLSARLELQAKGREKDKRSSTFPSGSGFSLPSSRRRSNLPPRQRSVTPSSSRATTPAPVIPQRSDRKRPAPQEPESPRSTSSSSFPINTSNVDVEVDRERYQFLRRLLSQEFVDMERENHAMIKSFDTHWSPSTITFLSSRFARRFIPDQSRRDVSSKLTVLATDISSCIAQHDPFNLQSVIQQLFGVLALYFSICVNDKTLDVLAQTIYTIHRLVSFYNEAIQYMLRDLQRAGQQAIYMKLIQCVDDFLQTLNMDAKQQRIPTDTLPDLTTVSYQDIKTWCAANRVDPCVLQSVSKPTVSRDTGEKAIIHIIDIYHHAFYYGSDIQSFHFLLREPSFLKLISPTTPLPILSRALDLLIRFTQDEDLSVFFTRTRLPNNEMWSVSDRLMGVINMSLRYESLYKEWYTVRIKSITLLKDTFATLSKSAREEWAHPDLLVQIGQTIFNDVWAIMDVGKPPYRPIPLDLSGRFIHVGLHLLNDMLSSFDAAMDTSGKTHDALLKIYMKMLPTVSKQWPEKHPAGKELKRMHRLLRAMQGMMQTESASTTMGTC
ncbi:hypothetical protein O0I10_005286, partial [Lichtheimia ornata]